MACYINSLVFSDILRLTSCIINWEYCTVKWFRVSTVAAELLHVEQVKRCIRAGQLRQHRIRLGYMYIYINIYIYIFRYSYAYNTLNYVITIPVLCNCVMPRPVLCQGLCYAKACAMPRPVLCQGLCYA